MVKVGRDKTRVYTPHATGRVESLAGLPLASFSARAAGFLADVVLVLIVYVPVMLLAQWLEAGRDSRAKLDVHFDFHDLSSLISVVIYFGRATYLGNGRTLGKRIMGTRVVSLVHPRMTLWQSIERALGYGASFLEGGFGFFQYFTHPNRCCVHDRIAETIVVSEKKPASGRPRATP